MDVEEVFDKGGDFINGQKLRERSFDVAYIHHMHIIWKIGKAHARPATQKINPLSPSPTTDDDDDDDDDDVVSIS